MTSQPQIPTHYYRRSEMKSANSTLPTYCNPLRRQEQNAALPSMQYGPGESTSLSLQLQTNTTQAGFICQANTGSSTLQQL